MRQKGNKAIKSSLMDTQQFQQDKDSILLSDSCVTITQLDDIYAQQVVKTNLLNVFRFL